MAENKRFNNMGALNNIIMVYPWSKTWDIRPENENTRKGIFASGISKMITRVTEDICNAPMREAELSIASVEDFLADKQTTY